MSAGIDYRRDLGEVDGHGVGVAPRHDEPRAFARLRADGAEDVGGFRALVMGCRRPRAAPRPAAGDPVLLADARLVGEPELYRRAGRERLADRRQPVGEVFLKAAICSSFWAWWRGRAESLPKPRVFSSRLSVASLIEMPNSSQTQAARSISRHRTTPSTAGIGPRSTIAASAARWVSSSFEGLSGGLGAAAAVVDHRQREQPAGLVRVSARPRQPLRVRRREVATQRQWPSHACLLAVFGRESEIAALGNPPRESALPQAGITRQPSEEAPDLRVIPLPLLWICGSRHRSRGRVPAYRHSSAAGFPSLPLRRSEDGLF